MNTVPIRDLIDVEIDCPYLDCPEDVRKEMLKNAGQVIGGLRVAVNSSLAVVLRRKKEDGIKLVAGGYRKISVGIQGCPKINDESVRVVIKRRWRKKLEKLLANCGMGRTCS